MNFETNIQSISSASHAKSISLIETNFSVVSSLRALRALRGSNAPTPTGMELTKTLQNGDQAPNLSESATSRAAIA